MSRRAHVPNPQIFGSAIGALLTGLPLLHYCCVKTQINCAGWTSSSLHQRDHASPTPLIGHEMVQTVIVNGARAKSNDNEINKVMEMDLVLFSFLYIWLLNPPPPPPSPSFQFILKRTMALLQVYLHAEGSLSTPHTHTMTDADRVWVSGLWKQLVIARHPPADEGQVWAFFFSKLNWKINDLFKMKYSTFFGVWHFGC